MKVILLSDIKDVGKKYEITEVKPGFARNFLFARGLGEAITKGTAKRVAELTKKREIENALKEELLQKAFAGLKEAVISGMGELEKKKVVIAVTDSRFIMGSMGSVVGERISRAIEKATALSLPMIIVSGSGGGARMYEGMFSLMQMAKTSGALSLHNKAGLLYISILTNPTMAGIMASFAGLGDLIIAEPKALIGFTGPRVIEQTIRQRLPADFQKSEFLLEHGLIDMIVPRKSLKKTLSDVIEYLT